MNVRQPMDLDRCLTNLVKHLSWNLIREYAVRKLSDK